MANENASPTMTRLNEDVACLSASGSPKRRRPERAEGTANRHAPNEIERPECQICANEICDPAIGGGCCHHFCRKCLRRWALTKPSCPTCRAPIIAITRDHEFAELIGAPSGSQCDEQESEIDKGCKVVSMTLPAGLTLGGESASGCMVLRTVPMNGAQQAGIKPGDVVLEVGGVQVRDHALAIALIEQHRGEGSAQLKIRPAFKPAAQLASGAANLTRRASRLPISPLRQLLSV